MIDLSLWELKTQPLEEQFECINSEMSAFLHDTSNFRNNKKKEEEKQKTRIVKF